MLLKCIGRSDNVSVHVLAKLAYTVIVYGRIAGAVGRENMRTPQPLFWRDWLALGAALAAIAGLVVAVWLYMRLH
jgi:hypothetical protein